MTTRNGHPGHPANPGAPETAPHLAADPLRDAQERAGAEWIAYGPASEDAPPAEIAATFGEYQAEYAAIRQRVGILHLPQRGVLRLVGADVADFLHRMVTHDIRGLPAGGTRRTLQLNEKGRIVADAIVHHGSADTWLELDRSDAATLKALLEKRLFAEDVTIEDISDQRVALVLAGPSSTPLLESLRTAGTPAAEIPPHTHHVLTLGGQGVTVYRWDDTGAPTFRLLVPTAAAADLYARLLDAAGFSPDAAASPGSDQAAQRRQGLRGRPIGWMAYNTARIEAGSPLFHIDFGTDSLPAETGILDHVVSFNKGCYLGQEIVARMRSLGHPKRLLVGLRFDSDALPLAGSEVLDPADRATVIGGVTSSALSPIRGNQAVAFAVMKWGKHTAGTKIVVPAEGRFVEAVVQGLRFLE